MISVGGASSGAYFTGGGGRAAGVDTYYTGAKTVREPPGQWSGRLAADLGLIGEVDPGQFKNLLEKFEAPDGSCLGQAPGQYRSAEDRVNAALAAEPGALPERQAEIRREVEAGQRQTKLAYDLTASPSKSVTVRHTALWWAEVNASQAGDEVRAGQYRAGREAVEAALERANATALEYEARHFQSRTGTHGKTGHAGRFIAAQDVAVASFFQHTNQSISPQLHHHNVAINRARCMDGEIRALDGKTIYGMRPAFSAVYDHALAEELAKVGLRMEVRPDGKAREIVGTPQAVIDLFSDRKPTITKAAQPWIERAEQSFGRPLTELEKARIKQRAALFTREAKHDTESPEEKLDRWQREMRDELATGMAPLAARTLREMEQGPVTVDRKFSPDAVVDAAIASVSERKAAWNRADLALEIERHLPVTGARDVGALLDFLVDRGLERVTQVSGKDPFGTPADVVGSYVRPADRKYAAPVTLEAEDLIRQAAIERGGLSLRRDDVAAWLGEKYPTLSPQQRAVVEGLATSDARLAQVVAAAGTGKSYAAGALSGAWDELSGGGRVQGLAVSQKGAEVLTEDGVDASNIAAWLAGQERLAVGRGLDDDRAVGPRDILMVDEASMVGTADLTRIREIADKTGARIVLVGDGKQLAAVAAGGVMGLLADRAEEYRLTEVRRFNAPWEADASLRLRDGDQAALAEYDRRGRLVDAGTFDEAIAAAARAAAADRIAGRSTVAVAGTNEDAGRLSAAIREQLVAAGIVPADGMHLSRDGGTAGVGDIVLARKNNYEIGVTNQDRYTVEAVAEDGSLDVVGSDGVTRRLPAAYVQENVQSGYAGTVHSAQGMTVETSHWVTDGMTDAAGVYVPLTRGRERNTAYVATVRQDENEAPGTGTLVERPSAFAVLAEALGREVDNRAARVEEEMDDARIASMDTILGRIEDGTRTACRDRLEQHLDELVADGVLGEVERARLGADQSTEHVSRLLRAVEQAGQDPQQALREAVEQRDFSGAQSVAEVLSHRINSRADVSGRSDVAVPSGLSDRVAGYLDGLWERATDRSRELGSQAAGGRPEWATRTLGAVPEDPVERLEWEMKAGRIAAYREGTGWDDPERAIGQAPGVTSTERRALWWGAWEASGRPEATRDEATLSDGQLLVRMAAWEREKMWAPPHADASLKKAELDAERARQDAILARAQGDEQTAWEREQEADRRSAVARGMAKVAEGRAAWTVATAQTQATAEASSREAERRGIRVGQEPDRTTAEEWLAAEQKAREVDDVHRVVTEADVIDEEVEAARRQLEVDREAKVAGERVEAEHLVRQDARQAAADADRETIDETTWRSAFGGWTSSNGRFREDLNPVAEAELIRGVELESDEAPETKTPEVDLHERSKPHAAHEEASEAPSLVELDAMVAAAADAEERRRDYESQEAAHEAVELEAEHTGVDIPVKAQEQISEAV